MYIFFIFKFKKYENFLSRYLIYLFVIVQLTCFSISKTLHRSLHASLHATRTYRLRTHRSKIFSRHVDKPSKKKKCVSKNIRYTLAFYICMKRDNVKVKKKNDVM